MRNFYFAKTSNPGYPATTLPLLNEQSMDVKLSISQASWFASITAIFSPIGGLLSGYMLDKFGRRTTLICINVISIISWLIIGYSSRTDVSVLFAQLMVARIIIGKRSPHCPITLSPRAIIHHNKNQTKLIMYFGLIRRCSSGHELLPGNCICGRDFASENSGSVDPALSSVYSSGDANYLSARLPHSGKIKTTLKGFTKGLTRD